MIFPLLSDEQRMKKLELPKGKIHIVLDTDTFNEIDDQFAVLYALLSPERIQVEAFYAAPFFNELSTGPKDGMEKSFEELEKIVGLMESEVPIYRGSEAYLTSPTIPVESAAARNLVQRAMASSMDDPLYVVAIGAITNVASAILMEPMIIEKMVVVWLGGHGLHWNNTKEFNLHQDLHASRILLDCGVPLVLIPCMGVSSHLQTSLSEMRDYVKEQGKIGDYLYTTYFNCIEDHVGHTRVIWDISVIAYLNNEQWLPSTLVHSPRISEDFRWSFDTSRHFIKCVNYIHRDQVFQDLFCKLRNHL